MKNTFQELQQQILTFVKARNWTKFHSPKNLSMSISIEAAELMELFQWTSLEESSRLITDDDEFKVRVKEEIADVIIYCLSFANATNIDLKAAVVEKIKKNEIKYPAP